MCVISDKEKCQLQCGDHEPLLYLLYCGVIKAKIQVQSDAILSVARSVLNPIEITRLAHEE